VPRISNSEKFEMILYERSSPMSDLRFSIPCTVVKALFLTTSFTIRLETSLKDEIERKWLNPRSRFRNFVHFRRLSTFANLLRLRSSVSIAGNNCSDSSMSTMPLDVHETYESLLHTGESLISVILLAKTCLRASCSSTKINYCEFS